MTAKAVNFVLFQIGWFACVLSAGSGVGYLGPIVAGMLVTLHLIACQAWRRELGLVLAVGGVGLVVDSGLAAAGVLEFGDQTPLQWLAPPWLISIWLIFATTLRSSLSWLAGRFGLAAVLGAVGGPAAYYAGQNLNALTLPDLNNSLVGLAVAWAVVTPLLVWFAHRGTARVKPR